MKKKKYKYKIYIDKKPIAMVVGSKEYINEQISYYFKQYLTEEYKEVKIIGEVCNGDSI